MDRILRMIFNQFLHKGINHGVNRVARGGNGSARKSQQADTDRQQQQGQKDMAKRARQALRAGRRIGRF